MYRYVVHVIVILRGANYDIVLGFDLVFNFIFTRASIIIVAPIFGPQFLFHPHEFYFNFILVYSLSLILISLSYFSNYNQKKFNIDVGMALFSGCRLILGTKLFQLKF